MHTSTAHTHTHTLMCAHGRTFAFPRQTTSIHFARHHQQKKIHIRERSCMPALERDSGTGLAFFLFRFHCASTGQIERPRYAFSLFPTRKQGSSSALRNDERVNKKEKAKKPKKAAPRTHTGHSQFLFAFAGYGIFFLLRTILRLVFDAIVQASSSSSSRFSPKQHTIHSVYV